MTLTMKRMLLQYGEIIFLDTQKRQYNKMCWPYIGPVIKIHENCVRYIAESIVIKEDLAMYKWVIESLSEMEPKWSPSNIKIILQMV